MVEDVDRCPHCGALPDPEPLQRLLDHVADHAHRYRTLVAQGANLGHLARKWEGWRDALAALMAE